MENRVKTEKTCINCNHTRFNCAIKCKRKPGKNNYRKDYWQPRKKGTGGDMREYLINQGVEASKKIFPYDGITRENILTDYAYMVRFRNMLELSLEEKPNKSARSLLEEIKEKMNIIDNNPKTT
jgi:hypothetical protein